MIPSKKNKKCKVNEFISLIFPLFSPTLVEVNYIEKLYKKFRDKINIYILIDGADISLEKFVDPNDIFISKKNVGKFNSIYNFVKSGNLKTPFIKICDPDDFININLLLKYDFSSFSHDDIIFHAGIRTTDAALKKKYSIKKIDKIGKSIISKSKVTEYKTFGNSWTIFPVRPLLQNNFYVYPDIRIHDDQVLGYICIANSSKISTAYDLKFYIYFNNELGATSYKSASKIFKEAKITFDYLNELYEISKFKLPNSFPDNYKWYFNKMSMNFAEFGYSKDIVDDFVNLYNGNLFLKNDFEIKKINVKINYKNFDFYITNFINDEIFDKIIENLGERFNYKNFLDEKYSIIYDLGSNIGITSTLFSKIFPKSKIISVEPTTKLNELFEYSNFLNNIKNIKIVEKAIDYSKGEFAKLYFSKNYDEHWGNTIIEGNIKIGGLSLSDFCLVETTTLEKLVSAYGQPDLIKIDIEGSEVDIIKYDNKILNESSFVQIEFHNKDSSLEILKESIKTIDAKVSAENSWPKYRYNNYEER